MILKVRSKNQERPKRSNNDTKLGDYERFINDYKPID
jgi:hypothetical protein